MMWPPPSTACHSTPSSVRSGSGRRASLLYALEEPDNSRSRQAKQGQPTEHVDKSPIGSLIQQLAVQLQFAGYRACAGPKWVPGRPSGLQRRLELLAAERAVVRHLALMDTAAPGQERGAERDSDRAANVAHQVIKPAGRTNLLPGQGSVGLRTDGTKTNPTPKPVIRMGISSVQG